MVRKINKAAVLGGGVMGGGIAALLAGAGVKTLLLDIVPFDLKPEDQTNKQARNRIAKAGLDATVAAQPALFMTPKDAARIEIGNFDDDLARLADCDWIVEVVVENLKIKQELMKKIGKVRKPGAIVSTNTSGIPLKHISEGLSREFRQHFLGTHFFNPVRYMKLLEIIPGEDTLPDILQFMAQYGEKRLGKGIVWAKDTPNFVGNRIGVYGIVKAMQAMGESGMSIPEVDALFGPALGRPKTAMFKTSDLVGLDVLSHVAKNTYDLVPKDEERNSFQVPEFIGKMIENKLLGNKTRAGFYKTDLTPEWKKIRKVINLKSFEYEEYKEPEFPCLAEAKKAKTLPDKIRAVAYGDDKGAAFAWKVLAHSLIYAANRIPEISDTIVEIDNAMKWGFNFELGPFETWDALGVAQSVEKMKKDGFKVPDAVGQMLASGCQSFYKTENGKLSYYDFASKTYQPAALSPGVILLNSLKAAGKVVKTCKSASLVDIGDDVFCVEFHSKMNAVNREIVEFIGEGLDYVGANGVGLVIGNQGGGTPGAFSAGGDLMYMASLAKEGKFADMDAFLKTAQDGLQKARYAPFPVVAAPYGLALGGGCEMCLGVDRIVAHAELYMGLVEIGVGLLPAGGGCLNLWKRFISSVPEPVTDYDLTKFFVPVFMSIAMAKVTTSAADARSAGFLGPQDRIVFSRDHLIGEAKKEVIRMAEDGYAPPVKRKIRVVGESAQGMINAELYNMLQAKFITEYDAFLAKRVAFVISGGEVRDYSEVDEDVILKLERDAFGDFWRQEKTVARVEHMLKTGKPLRN